MMINWVVVPLTNWRVQACLKGSVTTQLQLTLAMGEYGDAVFYIHQFFKRNQNLDLKWNLPVLKYWLIFKHIIYPT